MKKDARKKNIQECKEMIRDDLNGAHKDMRDDESLDIKLKNGQVLYCEKCHLLVAGEDDLCLGSKCKMSKDGLHDFIIVEGCGERIVFGCAECKDYHWYSAGSREECLRGFLKEPCKLSKNGKHVLVELRYLTGHVVSKPIISYEACLSVREVNQKPNLIQLHSIKK